MNPEENVGAGSARAGETGSPSDSGVVVPGVERDARHHATGPAGDLGVHGHGSASGELDPPVESSAEKTVILEPVSLGPPPRPVLGLSPQALAELRSLAATTARPGAHRVEPAPATAALADRSVSLVPGYLWPLSDSADPTPLYDELVATMPDPREEHETVGWQILPVRASAQDPVIDDYLLWSSVVDAPIFRGSRAELERFWRRSTGPVPQQRFDMLFELADQTGSSSRLGDLWGEQIICMNVSPTRSGLLARERLRALADAFFPAADATRDIEAIDALLTPFEDEGNEDE